MVAIVTHMSPHPKFMLPGKKPRNCTFAIIQRTGCWCRTCPQHSNHLQSKEQCGKGPEVTSPIPPAIWRSKWQSCSWKRWYSSIRTDSFCGRKKHCWKPEDSGGRRRGLKGSFSPTTHSKLIYEVPPPRLTTQCSKLLAQPIKSLKGILGARISWKSWWFSGKWDVTKKRRI